ncbi:MAG TPA: hypothetical protein VIV60_35630, partial [Polyangiaceae bacterium]
MRLERIALVVATASLASLPVTAQAAGEVGSPPPTSTGHALMRVIDRAAIRFTAPETGGVRAPRFIFARELAFEARLEALSDPEYNSASDAAYLDRHLHAAAERHIAETLLAALRVDPIATERQIEEQAEEARRILLDRIGGHEVLERAARSEAMNEGDVELVFRRRARAGIYLDRMVAPMLAPTTGELRQVYATDNHPYRQLAFEKALPLLRRWVVGQRLREGPSA